MRTILLALGFIFLSLPAFANFTGDWVGVLTLSINGQPVKKCQLGLGVTHTPTALEIVDGISCGEFFGWVYPNHLGIKGNSLLYNGREVGKITESEIHAADADEDNQKFFVDVVQTDGNTAEFYQKLTKEGPKGGVIEFNGTIFRNSGDQSR